MTAVQPRPKAKKRRRPSTDKNAATVLHSKIVRHAGRCEAVGLYGLDCSDNLQAAHIIRRARSGVRTDLENSRALCSTHHQFLDSHIADLIEFVGAAEYRRLQVKADTWTEERGSSLLWWRGERERLTAIARELGIR